MDDILRQVALEEAPATRSKDLSARSNQRIEVKIARGLDDLLMVYSIRAAVYMAEQNHLYAEQFDGNDHCATHFVGFVDGEPAGCLRVRFFADFCKGERMAVLKQYRKTGLAIKIAKHGFEYARRKGYTKFYGQALEGVENFWARFGGKQIGERFSFRGQSCIGVLGEFPPVEDRISLESAPMVLSRPEDDWDRPGILELSSARAAR
ncbi:MAG TPA: GNAT family N-acetyltransferase [Methylocella sp.]|nr:GNAT family N-acetyltransferase [Methylocella sp.]